MKLEESLKKGGSLANYMVSIDVSSNKYFIYSEGGLLCNRVDYSSLVGRFGVPIEVSNDGRNFIFCAPDKKSILHVLRLEISGFIFVKTIDVFKAIKTYYKNACDTAIDADEVERSQ